MLALGRQEAMFFCFSVVFCSRIERLWVLWLFHHQLILISGSKGKNTVAHGALCMCVCVCMVSQYDLRQQTSLVPQRVVTTGWFRGDQTDGNCCDNIECDHREQCCLLNKGKLHVMCCPDTRDYFKWLNILKCWCRSHISHLLPQISTVKQL